MTLPEKLLHYRKEAGLSQLELAERLDVSRQAVSRWESGAAVPSTENLKFLSGLYGVSVDVLLDDSAEPDEPVFPAASETKENRCALSVPRKWMIFLVIAVLLIGIGIGVGVTALREKEEVDIILQGDLAEKSAPSTGIETFGLEW